MKRITESRGGHQTAARGILGWLACLGTGVALAGGPQPPPNPEYPGKPPTKAANAPTVAQGGTITWTITIYNDYFDEAATVYLSDDVPDPASGYPVAPFDLNLVNTPSGLKSYNGNILSIQNIAIAGRQSVVVTFQTRVNANAPAGTRICNRAYTRHVLETCTGNPPACGTVNYDTQSRPPGATQPGDTCVDVVGPGPNVRPLSSSSTDSCPADPGFPAPDGVISPGETVSLTLRVTNIGTSNAAANPAPITGDLVAGAGYTILAGTSPYTTTGTANVLLANSANQGSNDVPFRIRVNPDVACPGSLTVEMSLRNIQGGPWRVTYDIPVGSGTGGCLPRCLDAPIAPGTPGVQDSCGFTPPGNNGNIDPGDDIILQLPVTNSGRDTLRGNPTITGTLSSQTPGVSVVAGSTVSDYPDLAPGVPGSNLTEFRIHVDTQLACGTPFTLRLTLANSNGGSRTVDFPFQVAQPCAVCQGPTCAIQAVATALSSTNLCFGGTVRLDSGNSSISCGGGGPSYQWLQDGVAIPSASGASYDVPPTMPPGQYDFQVQIGCSTCLETSGPVMVTVAPTPLVVKRLMAVKESTVNLVASWDRENTATGGYRLYRTADASLVGNARAGTANVFPAGATLPNPAATTLTDPGIVPPASGRKLYYQVLAVCLDDSTEGPN